MLGQSPCGAIHSLWALCLIAGSLVVAGETSPACAQGARQGFPDQTIQFDIPAQPLESALEAYGAATGLDVFYNAALAERRRSNPVIGAFTPAGAIQTMLAGTGYAPRVTMPGALTVIAVKLGDSPAAAATGAPDARYDPYFAIIQRQVSDILCAVPDNPASREDILLRIWLAPAGEIFRADVFGGGEKRGDLFATAIRQAKFAAPPAGMPQPLTLVIFPPSADAAKQCAPADRARAGRQDPAGNKQERPALPTGQAAVR